jgi:hypothetical protein
MRWLVEHVPEHPLLGRIGSLVLDVPDPSFYEQLGHVWRKKIELHPNSGQVRANAASFFKICDFAQSRLYISEAVQLAPHNPEVQRLDRIIAGLQRARSVMEETEDD